MGGMLNALVGSFAPATSSSTYESIATISVGSGGATTATFSSIPQTYTHLQLRFIGKANTALSAFSAGIRYNSDSGTNYTFHALYGGGGSGSTSAFGSVNQSYDYSANVLGTNTTFNFGVNVLDILDYTNTNKFKTIRTLSGADRNGAGGAVGFSGAMWRNTAAINSISISSGGYGDWLQYSHFALYGIKGA